MNVLKQSITLSAPTGGDITAATSGEITGQILSIHLQYASAASTGFATTAAITITSNVTSQIAWAETLSTLATTTVNIHRVPRQITHSTVGTALTATSGLEPQPIYLVNEKVVITTTSVGSGARSATLVIHYG